MKVGQVDKFMKARQDPSFARVMQVRDLNPDQASSQVKLRKAVQVSSSPFLERSYLLVIRSRKPAWKSLMVGSAD